MTPGVSSGTADGMSEAAVDEIIDFMRFERYRFAPARRVYIPKKNGKLRPLGIPSWRDKLVGEVVRLILEAIYEPSFSSRSHGFREKGADVIPHCGRSARLGPGRCGSSRATSPTASGPSTMRS